MRIAGWDSNTRTFEKSSVQRFIALGGCLMRTFIDYYEVLEVRENASDEVIKMAYKALALKYHPDRSSDSEVISHNQMLLINEAYMTLSNPEKRKSYDDQMKFRKTNNSNTYNDETGLNEEKSAKKEKTKYDWSGQGKEKDKSQDKTHQRGSTIILFSLSMIIIAVYLSSFFNLRGSNIELNPIDGTPAEKAERASRAIRIVKEIYSSGDGPEVWVKEDHWAQIYGWRAFNYNDSIFFVSYEFDNDSDKENGYNQYAFEVDINIGTVKPINGDSYLEEKYKELGF